MSRIFVVAGLYIGIFFGFSFLYLASFHTPLFNSENVLFYRGIELIICVFGAGLVSTLVVGLYTEYSYFETHIAALIASTAIHLAIFVVFPVTFDRSVTMFLLNTLEQSASQSSCRGITSDALEETFVRSYVYDQSAISRRIHEQSVIGMISNDAQCISITERGLNFLDFSRIVGSLYNLSVR